MSLTYLGVFLQKQGVLTSTRGVGFITMGNSKWSLSEFCPVHKHPQLPDSLPGSTKGLAVRLLNQDCRLGRAFLAATFLSGTTEALSPTRPGFWATKLSPFA